MPAGSATTGAPLRRSRSRLFCGRRASKAPSGSSILHENRDGARQPGRGASARNVRRVRLDHLAGRSGRGLPRTGRGHHDRRPFGQRGRRYPVSRAAAGAHGRRSGGGRRRPALRGSGCRRRHRCVARDGIADQLSGLLLGRVESQPAPGLGDHDRAPTPLRWRTIPASSAASTERKRSGSRVEASGTIWGDGRNRSTLPSGRQGSAARPWAEPARGRFRWARPHSMPGTVRSHRPKPSRTRRVSRSASGHPACPSPSFAT